MPTLDEVSDEDLEREVARRRMPLSQPTLENIRTELEHAWQKQNRLMFVLALSLLEAPDFSERRRKEMERKYRHFS